MTILTSIKGGEIKPGHKIYDYKHRAFDIVAYTELSDDAVFTQFKSFKDGFYEEDWKGYASYFGLDSQLLVLIDLPDIDSNVSSLAGVSISGKYVLPGDKIYSPEKGEYVLVHYISPTHDNMGKEHKARTVVIMDKEKVEGSMDISVSGSVNIIIDTAAITQFTNNHQGG